MGKTMRILMIGDTIGKPGRRMVARFLPELRARYQADLVIVNGENAAGGFGITPEVARELLDLGVHCITSGNHVWDKKEIYGYIASEPRLLRPANYAPGQPGRGFLVTEVEPYGKVAVLNLIGRVFMGPADCPFRAADAILANLPADVKVIVVDMHGDATSEKVAMGRYLDGRVSAVLGTHSHVVTADESLLPNGTAYLTDIGMTGPIDSVIGIKKELIIQKFLTSMPTRYEVAPGPAVLRAVAVAVDPDTGRAARIERVTRWEDAGVGGNDAGGE